MKKLAILCALACALVACEKPMNEEAKPEIKTVSFYSELRISSVPSVWGEIIGAKPDDIAKAGALFLTERGTFDFLENNGYLSGTAASWKTQPGYHLAPVDSNYYYNPNDLTHLFRTGVIKSVASIYSPQGYFKDIPYGNYDLFGVLGLMHDDTLKTFRCTVYRNLIIDKAFNQDTIELRVSAGPYFMSYVN